MDGRDLVVKLTEIQSHIFNFRDLIHCLNILGRLRPNEKLVTPKQASKPWRMQIQTSPYWWSSWITSLIRSTNKDNHYSREDNLEYIKAMIEDLRKEFTYLFHYMSQYVIQSNKIAGEHWQPREPKDAPLMTFDNKEPMDQRVDSPLCTKHTHVLAPKKDDRSFILTYSLCRCFNCSLSHERMIISRIGELLVQALVGITRAKDGIENLKSTYNDDDHVFASIEATQSDLNSLISLYSTMSLSDLLKFSREFIGDQDEMLP